MIDHSASFRSVVRENWHRWTLHTVQLFTLSHLFWSPSVFQGHKMYLLLAGENFSSLYLIFPKDFSPVMLIVYPGLCVGVKWGRRVFASSRNVLISRNTRQISSAWGKGVIIWICCIAPHSTWDTQWGGTGHWHGAQPGALASHPAHGANVALEIHFWAVFLIISIIFVSSN